MTSEQGDEYRREIIRRLEQEKANLQAEKARIDAALADTKKRSEALNAALLRAYQPPLSNDICFSCWINHGDKVVLKAVPENAPLGMCDRFVCSKCGHEELREA